MVVKKYLCAAPRPESWKAKADALLKSLGGDKVKRVHVARQTLDVLKERHKQEKKRTGPGRKSNAEHAIAFYEYLLTDKGTDDDEDSNTLSSSSSDEDGNSTSDQSSSSKTIDTEEFLNQHDDACDVCNLGGKLICCSTCTLVFHKECLRPIVKSIPSDWSCPHCITQGIKNYKRHSKTWKAAASGIRQMKRMKIECERGSDQSTQMEINQKEGEHDDPGKINEEESDVADRAELSNAKSIPQNNTASLHDEGKQGQKIREIQGSNDQFSEENKKPSIVEGNTSTASSVSSTGAASDHKRNLALYKIADSYSNSTEELLVRGRRQRKQPTLYQPQLCADSRWKSDEKNIETDKANDDDETESKISDATDGDADSSKEERNEFKSRNHNTKEGLKSHDLKNAMGDKVIICVGEDAMERKKSGSPFCNFCHDDASIPICVFCGCRACFGKHDKTNLLLCDNCDDEYHTRCLGLTTVPSAQKWYCPACSKTKTTSSPKHSTRRSSSTTTQFNALEAGSETDNSKRSSSKKKNRSLSTKMTRISPPAANNEAAEKRYRGRPPKPRLDRESALPSSASPRKRARIPKAAANAIEIVEPRKRGRPSKSTTQSAGNTPNIGRKRGRPPKKNPTSIHTGSSKSTLSLVSRKRGRPPKVNPDTVASSNKVDCATMKKTPKTTTPSSSPSSKKPTNSTPPEVSVKIQEPIKVSRVSGRTVKRASFHDEVDEGEQHLRSSKSPQSGDNHSTSNSLKASLSKSQEYHTHRAKISESPEPARKKPKLEESVVVSHAKATLSETKTSKAQNKPSMIVEDNDEEIIDPPPIAPVRMKPVLQPPAQPIAPARMKPVLKPSSPAMRPPISAPGSPKEAEKKGSIVEETKKSVGDSGNNEEEKNKPKVPLADAIPVVTKSESSNKTQAPQATPLPPPPISTPVAAAVIKTTVPTNDVPKASPLNTQEVPGSKSTSGVSIIANYPSTPLLDPVALEAAVKALPEPKESKGEKTGNTKTPRRKPGARECMQISRRFGVNIIPEKYMTILLDYCRRGKVEHLIKMRERLDCHSRFLEYQLAGLEARVKEVGESKVVVPASPPQKRDSASRHRGGSGGIAGPPISVNKKPTLGGSTTKVAVAGQAFGKKSLPTSQATAMAASKMQQERTDIKHAGKPTTGSKHPIPSSSTSAKPVSSLSS